MIYIHYTATNKYGNSVRRTDQYNQVVLCEQGCILAPKLIAAIREQFVGLYPESLTGMPMNVDITIDPEHPVTHILSIVDVEELVIAGVRLEITGS